MHFEQADRGAPSDSSKAGVGKRFRLLGHFGESRRRTRPEKTKFPRKGKFIKVCDTINYKRVSSRWKQHRDRPRKRSTT